MSLTYGGSKGSSATSVTFLLVGPFLSSSRGDSIATFSGRLRPLKYLRVSAEIV